MPKRAKSDEERQRYRDQKLLREAGLSKRGAERYQRIMSLRAAYEALNCNSIVMRARRYMSGDLAFPTEAAAAEAIKVEQSELAKNIRPVWNQYQWELDGVGFHWGNVGVPLYGLTGRRDDYHFQKRKNALDESFADGFEAYDSWRSYMRYYDLWEQAERLFVFSRVLRKLDGFRAMQDFLERVDDTSHHLRSEYRVSVLVRFANLFGVNYILHELNSLKRADYDPELLKYGYNPDSTEEFEYITRFIIREFIIFEIRNIELKFPELWAEAETEAFNSRLNRPNKLKNIDAQIPDINDSIPYLK